MKKIWIPQTAAIVMILWAFNTGNPYGYYILLRVVCCASFAYLAFAAFSLRNQGWAWIMGVLAVIFNPFFPLHLTRDIWSVVDVAALMILVASIFQFKDGNLKNKGLPG